MLLFSSASLSLLHTAHSDANMANWCLGIKPCVDSWDVAGIGLRLLAAPMHL